MTPLRHNHRLQCFSKLAYHSANPKRGVALVISLSSVVLLTAVILAYFSRAYLNRQISFSSISQMKAEGLVDSALDIIVGELREEIRSSSVTPDSSNNLVQNGVTVYRPGTAASMVLQKAGVSSADSIGAVTIACVSGNNVAIYDGGRVLGSGDSIGMKSANGRSCAQWFSNGPRLGSAELPTWAYVTRNNSVTASPSAAANKRSGDYVVGRFAYTVYDTGGLLNANIAGYPVSSPCATSGSDVSGKGSQTYADLTALGLSVSAVDSLVGWRNAVTGTTSAIFREWALGQAASSGVVNSAAVKVAQGGHLDIVQGDNAFLNRRDLLRYVSLQNASVTPSNFTVFARSLESPSWVPPQDASGLGGNDAGLGGIYGTQSYKYATDCEKSVSINRDLANVRVTGTFTRADGTTARVGEPLLKSKFALSRIAGLGHNGVDSSANTTLLDGKLVPATAATIQRDFGLVWNTDHWDYCGPTGTTVQSSIPTIGSIGNREPNFFELLKAGILAGSVGVRSDANSLALIQPGERSFDAHLIQIGVNIIDQATATDYPTCIQFNVPNATSNTLSYTLASTGTNADFFGIKNLPYLAELRNRIYRTDDAATPGQFRSLKGNILVELWNPHQNAGSANIPVRAAITDLVAGNLPRVEFNWSLRTSGGIGSSLDPDPYIEIGNLSSYGEPHYINPTDVTDKTSSNYLISSYKYPPVPKSVLKNTSTVYKNYDVYFPNAASDSTDGSWCNPSNLVSGRAQVEDQIGFYLGSVTTGSYTSYITGNWGNCGADIQYGTTNGSGGYTFELRYYDGTSFRPYQRISKIGTPWANSSLGYSTDPGWINAIVGESYAGVYGRPDPRGGRFGLCSLNSKALVASSIVPVNAGMNLSVMPAAGLYKTSSFSSPQGVSFPGLGTGQYPTGTAWGFYADNTGTTGVSTRPVYLDPDGVQRRGDADTADGVNPLYTGNAALRSPVLSRRFYNAGEMGYAYRDQPFKTLDFFSAQSGDSGLLDLFCAHETASKKAMTANRLNLNSINAATSAALFQGAGRSFDSGTSISSDAALTIGSDFAAFVADSPLFTVADIATKFSAMQGGANPTFRVDGNYPALKTQREAVVRALSECGQTRTWNLLIDVVAQTGRFSNGAISAKQFCVEGEKRYWLHVAIDRITGKIIDQMLEPMNE